MIGGVCLRDLPGEPTTSAELADAARELGASVVHVPSPEWFTDDASALREAGIEVAVGLGQLTAVRGDWIARVERAQQLGAGSVHLSVGTVEHRASPEWPTILKSATGLLRELVAVGVPVVLKTHEDMSTLECLDVVDEVPGLRIGYSPVNVLVRMEDPLLAAERVAPLVHTVFLDDATVGWVPDGLHRWMRPVGSGSVPWAELLPLFGPEVPVVLDLHRAEFDIPFRTAGFADGETHLSVADVLAVVRSTHSGGNATAPMTERREAGWAALRAIHQRNDTETPLFAG